MLAPATPPAAAKDVLRIKERREIPSWFSSLLTLSERLVSFI